MNKKIAKVSNRTTGLVRLIAGGIIIGGGGFFIPIGGIFAIEGLGDFVTGDHHYVSSRVINYLSKRKIKIEYQFDNYKK